eukprot:5260747-Amphidinium_carterae.1
MQHPATTTKPDTSQKTPCSQRPSATPFVYSPFLGLHTSTTMPFTTSSADEDAMHLHQDPTVQRCAITTHITESAQSSPAASFQHQFATPPPTPEASHSPPPPELSRPPCNKARSKHWASPHELPEQGTVASLVTQYDKPTLAAIHQVGPIPSISTDDMPPEITGSAESEIGASQAKSMETKVDMHFNKSADLLSHQYTMVEDTIAPNPQSIVSQPIKHTQPRMSTPPRYGDVGYKPTHISDTPVISIVDRPKPKQIFPVLEVQEHSQAPPTQHSSPQAPSRKRFAIVIRSADYLEQLRAARVEQQDQNQDVDTTDHRQQPISDPSHDAGRLTSEQGTSGITNQVSSETQNLSSAVLHDSKQATPQPQQNDIASVTRMLLPSVVAVPPPAHSPRVALQQPYDDPERTRKLLEMAHAALCPPLLHEHVEQQRQPHAPVGADPRLIPHVSRRTARRRAAAQLRDMERERHAHQNEHPTSSQLEEELQEPTTPIAAQPTSDDVLYTPTRSEAEDMCEDLARSLTPSKTTPSKQVEPWRTTTEGLISIATLPASQPLVNQSALPQTHGISSLVSLPDITCATTKENQGQQVQSTDDIKLPTVTTHFPKYKAPPTGIGCRPHAYVQPPDATNQPPNKGALPHQPQPPPLKAEQVRAGDTDSAIQQAIASQRPVCARYKQAPAGTIPVGLKTGGATTPICKQPPVPVVTHQTKAVFDPPLPPVPPVHLQPPLSPEESPSSLPAATAQESLCNPDAGLDMPTTKVNRYRPPGDHQAMPQAREEEDLPDTHFKHATAGSNSTATSGTDTSLVVDRVLPSLDRVHFRLDTTQVQDVQGVRVQVEYIHRREVTQQVPLIFCMEGQQHVATIPSQLASHPGFPFDQCIIVHPLTRKQLWWFITQHGHHGWIEGTSVPNERDLFLHAFKLMVNHPYVDPTKIFFFGFSAGAYAITELMPHFQRLPARGIFLGGVHGHGDGEAACQQHLEYKQLEHRHQAHLADYADKFADYLARITPSVTKADIQVMHNMYDRLSNYDTAMDIFQALDTGRTQLGRPKVYRHILDRPNAGGKNK